jgi:hypothetical protein
MMKILILDIHGPYEPWLQILRNGQLKTWALSTDQSRIVHVSGSRVPSVLHKIGEFVYSLKWSQNKYIGKLALLQDLGIKIFLQNWLPPVKPQNKFLVPVEESWHVEMPDFALLMGHKVIASLNYSLSQDYDYLVTTITSAYIHVPRLERFLENQPREGFLGGRLTELSGFRFQQGSFRVYSRDVVEWIVNNRNCYRHWLPEDVAMGKLVNKLMIELTELPDSTAYSLDELYLIPDEELKKALHVRCKGSRIKNQESRNDVEILHTLHQIMKKLDSQ